MSEIPCTWDQVIFIERAAVDAGFDEATTLRLVSVLHGSECTELRGLSSDTADRALELARRLLLCTRTQGKREQQCLIPTLSPSPGT